MSTVEFNTRLLEMQSYLEYFARKLTNNNHEDAKDLVQETMLKALTFREKFVHQTNFKAWLFTIMKNIFINNYRRNVKARTIIDTTDNLYYLNNSSESPTAPDSEFSEKEIRKSINKLEDDHRIPFEMHTQGFKYKEIAEELDISIGTVKSRIFFGRRKLMDSLKDYQN
jgi:RNA polymerase sigma-70 factor (ECF subfamily)